MKKLLTFITIISALPLFGSAQNIFPASGNVGIGTTTPDAALKILRTGADATTNYPSLHIKSSGTGSAYGPILYLDGSAGTNGRLWGIVSSGAFDASATGSGGNFAVYDGTAGLTRFVINSSGNVGLGTNTPAAKLEVAGNVILTGTGYYKAGTNNWFGSANALINGTAAATDLGIRTDGNIIFMKSGGTESARFNTNGNLAIGTTDTKGYKLAVNGSAIATEMFVKLHGDWPDFVFKPTYALAKLSEVKSYIDANQHLPDMPSASEVAEKGINLGEMNKKLVKKVEELTLYLIEKDKDVIGQELRIKILEEQINLINQKVNR